MSSLPNRPADIAFFLPTLGGGGAERNILRLAGGVIRAGYSVAVIVGNADGPNLAWVPPAATLIDLRARRMVFALWPLVRVLRRQPPRLLVAALDEANVTALIARTLARARLPVVISIRIAQSASESYARGFRARLALPWLVRRWYPRADRMIVVSKAGALDLCKTLRLAEDRAIAIPNPVLDARVAELQHEPISHPWLQTIGAAPLILAVGRLAVQKDYLHLLEAFARLRVWVPAARLAILGDGPERAVLEHRIDTLGLGEAVLLAGFVANPYAWMRRASVFALSSRFEGLPTVLIEALACGARVVATDCPTGPAEILDDGRWGSLVPLGDVDRFAAALRDELARGRWPAPPDEALARYSEQPVVAAFEAVIAPLLERPSPVSAVDH